MRTQTKKSTLIVLLILITLTAFSQPGTKVEEFKRKRHWLGGTWGHPYTMFDKHNEKTFEETVNEIRRRIKEEKKPIGESGPVFKAYKLDYDCAMKSIPTDNGMPISVPSA